MEEVASFICAIFKELQDAWDFLFYFGSLTLFTMLCYRIRVELGIP